MFFDICNGFLIFLSHNGDIMCNERGGGYMHIHVKLRAKYRRMERNNLNMRQQIFMIFTHNDQYVERKLPFDFQVQLICRCGFIGLRLFG